MVVWVVVVYLLLLFVVDGFQLWTSDAQGDDGDLNTAAAAAPANNWLHVPSCRVSMSWHDAHIATAIFVQIWFLSIYKTLFAVIG